MIRTNLKRLKELKFQQIMLTIIYLRTRVILDYAKNISNAKNFVLENARPHAPLSKEKIKIMRLLAIGMDLMDYIFEQWRIDQIH